MINLVKKYQCDYQIIKSLGLHDNYSSKGYIRHSRNKKYNKNINNNKIKSNKCVEDKKIDNINKLKKL